MGIEKNPPRSTPSSPCLGSGFSPAALAALLAVALGACGGGGGAAPAPAPTPPPTLALPNLADATPVTLTVGTMGSVPFTNSGGGSLTGCAPAGALPAGLALSRTPDNSSCQITGAPRSAAAVVTITVTASNATGPDATPATVRITVEAAPLLAAPDLADAPDAMLTVGQQATIPFTNSGGGSLTGCAPAGALPAGLALSRTPDNSSCQITGAPRSAAAVVTITVTASNATGPDATPATVRITVAAAPLLAAPDLADAPDAMLTVGQQATIPFTNSGGGSLTGCASTDALPAGLVLSRTPDNSSCQITGDPMSAAAVVTITVTASNATGPDATPATVRITVEAAPLLAAPDLADAPDAMLTVGQQATIPFTNSGGGSLTGCASTDDLPAGLALSRTPDNSSCQISGNPRSAAAVVTITVTASNATGPDATPATVRITVAVPIALPDLQDLASAIAAIATLPLRPVPLANSGGGDLLADDATPDAGCSASGLPVGLRVERTPDGNSCQIAGTPSAATLAPAAVTVTARNATGADATPATAMVSVGAAVTNLVAPALIEWSDGISGSHTFANTGVAAATSGCNQVGSFPPQFFLAHHDPGTGGTATCRLSYREVDASRTEAEDFVLEIDVASGSGEAQRLRVMARINPLPARPLACRRFASKVRAAAIGYPVTASGESGKLFLVGQHSDGAAVPRFVFTYTGADGGSRVYQAAATIEAAGAQAGYDGIDSEFKIAADDGGTEFAVQTATAAAVTDIETAALATDGAARPVARDNSASLGSNRADFTLGEHYLFTLSLDGADPAEGIGAGTLAIERCEDETLPLVSVSATPAFAASSTAVGLRVGLARAPLRLHYVVLEDSAPAPASVAALLANASVETIELPSGAASAAIYARSLSAGQSYTAYLVAEGEGTAYSPVRAVDFATAAAGSEDTAAPVTTGPALGAVTSSSATLTVSSDEPGELYAAAVPHSASAPAAMPVDLAALRALGGAARADIPPLADGESASMASVTIGGLASGEEYRVFYAAVDVAGNPTGVLPSGGLALSATDITPPEVSAVMVSRPLSTVFNLSLRLSEPAEVFVLVLSTIESPPSASDVTSPAANAIAARLPGLPVGDSMHTITPPGLGPGAIYRAYIVARDAAGRESAVVASDDFITNSPPVPLIAGGDQTVDVDVTVTLDGSRSSDIDGDIVSYSWRQVAGTPVRLSDNQAAVTTFSTADLSALGETLVFVLEVTDEDGETGPGRSVTITVRNSVPTPSLRGATFDVVATAPARIVLENSGGGLLNADDDPNRPGCVVTGGPLPPGLSISRTDDFSTCQIVGTPDESPGGATVVYGVTVTASGAGGDSTPVAVVVRVHPPGPFLLAPADTLVWTALIPRSYPIRNVGLAPASMNGCEMSGLPPGVSGISVGLTGDGSSCQVIGADNVTNIFQAGQTTSSGAFNVTAIDSEGRRHSVTVPIQINRRAPVPETCANYSGFRSVAEEHPWMVGGDTSRLYLVGEHSNGEALPEFAFGYTRQDGDDNYIYQLPATIDAAGASPGYDGMGSQFRIASDDDSTQLTVQTAAATMTSDVETAPLSTEGASLPLARSDGDAQESNRANFTLGSSYLFTVSVPKESPGKGLGVGTLAIERCVDESQLPRLQEISGLGDYSGSAAIPISPIQFVNSGGSGILPDSSDGCVATGLPDGLAISRVTGAFEGCEITGIPAAHTVGRATVMVTARNMLGLSRTPIILTIEVLPAPTAPVLFGFTQSLNLGIPVRYPVSNRGLSPAESNGCEASGLPAGLGVELTPDGRSCQLAGIPEAVGTSNVAVTATDQSGGTSTATIPIVVFDPDAAALRYCPLYSKWRDFDSGTYPVRAEETMLTVPGGFTQSFTRALLLEGDHNFVSGREFGFRYTGANDDDRFVYQLSAFFTHGDVRNGTEGFDPVDNLFKISTDGSGRGLRDGPGFVVQDDAATSPTDAEDGSLALTGIAHPVARSNSPALGGNKANFKANRAYLFTLTLNDADPAEGLNRGTLEIDLCRNDQLSVVPFPGLGGFGASSTAAGLGLEFGEVVFSRLHVLVLGADDAAPAGAAALVANVGAEVIEESFLTPDLTYGSRRLSAFFARGLTPGAAYTAYFVVEDALMAYSPVSELDFTAAAAGNVDGADPTAMAPAFEFASASSVTFSAQSDEPGELYAVALPHSTGSPATVPSDLAVLRALAGARRAVLYPAGEASPSASLSLEGLDFATGHKIFYAVADVAGNDSGVQSSTALEIPARPSLADATATTLTVGVTADIAFINNGGGRLTECAASGLPAGLRAVVSDDMATCRITGVPGAATTGAATATVTATNITGSDMATVDITVIPIMLSGVDAADVKVSTASINLTSNVAGTAYVIVVADGTSPPGPAAVRHASIGGIAASANAAVAANVQATVLLTGLQRSSNYDAFVVVEALGNNLSAVVKVDLPTPAGPMITSFEIVIARGTTASIALTSNADGTAYVAVVGNTAEAPDAAAIVAAMRGEGGIITAANVAVTANTQVEITLDGLLSARNYDLYVVVEATDGLSVVLFRDLFVLPPRPVLTAAAVDVRDTSATINLTSDFGGFITSGTAYVAVLVDGASAPNDAAIVAAMVAGDVVFVANAAVTIGTPSMLSLTGLRARTMYDVYIVVRENVNRQFSAVIKVDLTTAAPPPTPMLSAVTAAKVEATTAEINLTSDVGGTAYVAVLENDAAAPTAAAVVGAVVAPGVVFATGSVAVAAAMPATVPLTGLVASTRYDAYVVVQAAGVLSAVMKVDVDTLARSSFDLEEDNDAFAFVVNRRYVSSGAAEAGSVPLGAEIRLRQPNTHSVSACTLVSVDGVDVVENREVTADGLGVPENLDLSVSSDGNSCTFLTIVGDHSRRTRGYTPMRKYGVMATVVRDSDSMMFTSIAEIDFKVATQAAPDFGFIPFLVLERGVDYTAAPYALVNRGGFVEACVHHDDSVTLPTGLVIGLSAKVAETSGGAALAETCQITGMTSASATLTSRNGSPSAYAFNTDATKEEDTKVQANYYVVAAATAGALTPEARPNGERLRTFYSAGGNPFPDAYGGRYFEGVFGGVEIRFPSAGTITRCRLSDESEPLPPPFAVAPNSNGSGCIIGPRVAHSDTTRWTRFGPTDFLVIASSSQATAQPRALRIEAILETYSDPILRAPTFPSGGTAGKVVIPMGNAAITPIPFPSTGGKLSGTWRHGCFANSGTLPAGLGVRIATEEDAGAVESLKEGQTCVIHGTPGTVAAEASIQIGYPNRQVGGSGTSNGFITFTIEVTAP